MIKLDFINKLPEKPSIFRQKISYDNGGKYLFNVTLFFPESQIISSGTDQLENIAINKACCEAVERFFYEEFKFTKIFRFDEFNSTDCLAAGFFPEKAVSRSNNESVERYVKLLISESNLVPRKIEIEEFPSSVFVERDARLDAFGARVEFTNYSGFSCESFFIIVLYQKGSKFVTGSAVRSSYDDAFLHSWVEAKRNLYILNNINSPPYDSKANANDEYLKIISKNGQAVVELMGNQRLAKDRVVLPKISSQFFQDYMGIYLSRSFLQGYQLKPRNPVILI